MKIATLCVVPSLLLTLTACGSISTGDDSAVLATMQGELTNPHSLALPETVRVAVVWGQERDGFAIAQDVEVEPVFPSKFRLALTSAPPDSAMFYTADEYADEVAEDADESGDRSSPLEEDADFGGVTPRDVRVAYGSLVAYEDTNGNGRLDLVEDGAAAFVDRVLGTNSAMVLVYLEGNVSHPEFRDENGVYPTPGYNLLMQGLPCGLPTPPSDSDEGDDTAGDDNVEPSPCVENQGWQTIDTQFELPLSANPEFNDLMCKSGGGDSEDMSTGGGGRRGVDDRPTNTDPGPEGYPSADDDELICDANGKGYEHTRCVETNYGLCRGSSSTCTLTLVGLPEGDVPAQWPCPIP